MSRKKKILIVFHLCFACSFLFWLLIQPYAKEIATQKSQVNLYKAIMEHELLFKELPVEEQKQIAEGYALAKEKKKPALIKELGTLFFVTTPPFALAWLFFSLVICLLLLFSIEGAAHAAWLLPLIVIGHFFFSKENALPKEGLFPPESYVLENYVTAVEKKKLNTQDALRTGWHRYLVKEWAKEEVSEESALFAEQLEKALFLFNVARLKWILDGKGDEVVIAGFTKSSSLPNLVCYFIWNLSFAWFINRKEKKAPCAAPSNTTC